MTHPIVKPRKVNSDDDCVMTPEQYRALPPEYYRAIREILRRCDVVIDRGMPNGYTQQLAAAIAPLRAFHMGYERVHFGAPPRLGHLLICVFTPVSRQLDRLGDFDGLYNTIWVPRFGRHLASLVYVIQAVRTAVTIIGVSILTAAISRVWSAFSR